VVQVYTKVFLKCFMEVSGEPCVMMDSLMHQRESFVTCSDTGRSFINYKREMYAIAHLNMSAASFKCLS